MHTETPSGQMESHRDSENVEFINSVNLSHITSLTVKIIFKKNLISIVFP